MPLAKQIEVLWITLPPVFVITALLALWGPSLFGRKSQPQRAASSKNEGSRSQTVSASGTVS